MTTPFTRRVEFAVAKAGITIGLPILTLWIAIREAATNAYKTFLLEWRAGIGEWRRYKDSNYIRSELAKRHERRDDK
jgi:hypothetical protein